MSLFGLADDAREAVERGLSALDALTHAVKELTRAVYALKATIKSATSATEGT